MNRKIKKGHINHMFVQLKNTLQQIKNIRKNIENKKRSEI